MPFRHEGFFHALQQDPENDGLRLIYADFLDERGDEESAAHAELLRVQVELATTPPPGPGSAGRVEALTAWQNELLARWQHVWLGDRTRVLHGWTFRRGLVEAVWADADAFLECAPEWFAEWPTLTVAKLTRAGHLLPQLAASPWLAHLRGLDLADNGIDSAGLAYLTASRFVCLLQALDLSDNPIGPRGAALLAAARSADDLSELHLARCGLWHEGLLALLGRRPDRPARWRRLDLSGNGLYRLGLVRLADSPAMRHLEALDLAGNPLGDNGASALADSPNAAGLVDLGLCGTGTGDAGVTALATSPHLANLRSLDLRGHHCLRPFGRAGEDPGGIADLADSPRLAQLRRLLLGHRPGPGNGWTARVLSPLRPPRTVEVERGGWVADVLRGSRYLMPSQLVECDLDELWWLGDTRNRDRLPTVSYPVLACLDRFPELLDELPGAEAAVLRMRYGLEEGPRTLREIGDRLGLTHERVRQVETEALDRLRKLWERRRPADWEFE